MLNQFSRTELMFGENSMKKLYNARVAVFGIGGVGGYVTEALARSGIGTLDIIDNDKVSLTNINRQIIATLGTVGMYKTEAAKKRISDISPDTRVNTYNCFYLPETAGNFNFKDYDYIVDAIDTLKGKIELAVRADKAGVPIISAMGAGNKTDPTLFKVTDIYKTKVCPLARVMRYELKKRGVKKLKVVYSEEIPLKPDEKTLEGYLKQCEKEEPGALMRRGLPGSNSFVPPVAGLIIAGEVIKDIIDFKR